MKDNIEDNLKDLGFNEIEDGIYKNCCKRTEKTENISVDTTNNGGIHMNICNRLNKIYLAKNKDYGNSFGEQYQEYGITSSVIRLDDKMRRLKQITKNDANVEE